MRRGRRLRLVEAAAAQADGSMTLDEVKCALGVGVRTLKLGQSRRLPRWSRL
jgi:hypothetical protein